MKFNYYIEQGARFVRMTFSGEVTLLNLLSAVSRVLGDSRYSPQFDGVADFSESTLKLSPLDVDRFAQFVLSQTHCRLGEWGVRVTAPMSTAFAMLYKQKAVFRHGVSIFSSNEGEDAFMANLDGELCTA